MLRRNNSALSGSAEHLILGCCTCALAAAPSQLLLPLLERLECLNTCRPRADLQEETTPRAVVDVLGCKRERHDAQHIIHHWQPQPSRTSAPDTGGALLLFKGGATALLLSGGRLPLDLLLLCARSGGACIWAGFAAAAGTRGCRCGVAAAGAVAPAGRAAATPAAAEAAGAVSSCGPAAGAVRRRGTLAASPAYRRTSALTVGGALLSTAGLCEAAGFRVCGPPAPLLRRLGVGVLETRAAANAATAGCGAAGCPAAAAAAGAPAAGAAGFCLWVGAAGRSPRLRFAAEGGVDFLAAAAAGGPAAPFLLGLPLGSAASGARAGLRPAVGKSNLFMALSVDGHTHAHNLPRLLGPKCLK